MTDSAAPQALGFEGFFRGAFSYHFHNFWYISFFSSEFLANLSSSLFLRWKPFDPARNWPDLGPRFAEGERITRQSFRRPLTKPLARHRHSHPPNYQDNEDRVEDDRRDLDWATVLKRAFESYIRGERPNMYGEVLRW